jgi:uncharacterized membrane protein
MRVREFLKQRSPVQIAFEISIFFKGLEGVLEIVGGLLLFFVKPRPSVRSSSPILDLVAIGLTWLEYGRLKRTRRLA